MASQRLVFKQVFEHLFLHGLADRLTNEVRTKLTERGVDLGKLLPGYDFEVWEASVLEATALFPELSKADALTELGKRLARASIEQNPVGASLMPILRVLGTGKALRRSLKRSNGENYNVVTFGAETSTSLEVSMSDVGTIPEFVRGSMIVLLQALGAKGVQVSILAHQAPAASFLAQWG